MTSRKIPSVRMLIGKVMIFRNSPTVAFSSPITSAAIKAGTQTRHVKSRHEMGNNEQRDRAQYPMKKKPHASSPPAKRPPNLSHLSRQRLFAACSVYRMMLGRSAQAAAAWIFV